jgi:hypothetical protein
MKKRAEKLTAGEVTALTKLVTRNGIHGTQWTPSGVRMDTMQHLATKGYLTGTWHPSQVERHGVPRIVGSE